MATIKEIAQLAGVSGATVSRVLSLDETFSASDDTRQRIFDIAQLLEYRGPGGMAERNLRVAMIELFSEEDELLDPYYLAIKLHVLRTARAER